MKFIYKNKVLVHVTKRSSKNICFIKKNGNYYKQIIFSKHNIFNIYNKK